MFVADGGKSVEALLGATGEPYRPEMQMYADAKELGVYDMWKLQLERSELQRQYLEQWMSIEGLDAILGEHHIQRDPLSILTYYSTHYAIFQRTAWRLQVCRIHRGLQCSRLLCCVFSLQCLSRQGSRQVYG
jgi:hypothetical protein